MLMRLSEGGGSLSGEVVRPKRSLYGLIQASGSCHSN